MKSETTSKKIWDLTDEGNYVMEHGSHEAAVFNSVPSDGISQADLMKASINPTLTLQLNKSFLISIFADITKC